MLVHMTQAYLVARPHYNTITPDLMQVTEEMHMHAVNVKVFLLAPTFCSWHSQLEHSPAPPQAARMSTPGAKTSTHAPVLSYS